MSCFPYLKDMKVEPVPLSFVFHINFHITPFIPSRGWPFISPVAFHLSQLEGIDLSRKVTRQCPAQLLHKAGFLRCHVLLFSPVILLTCWSFRTGFLHNYTRFSCRPRHTPSWGPFTSVCWWSGRRGHCCKMEKTLAWDMFNKTFLSPSVRSRTLSAGSQ